MTSWESATTRPNRAELNEDTLWHGDERIDSQLSPSHVNRYDRAAEIVLDRAFPAKAAEARKARKTVAGMTGKQLHID